MKCYIKVVKKETKNLAKTLVQGILYLWSLLSININIFSLWTRKLISKKFYEILKDLQLL